jgi:UDP-glucose 4-epimerase
VLFDLRPRWGYAAAKASVEHLVAGLFSDEGVPAWIVRPFNMSGARQRPTTGQVIPLFAAAALRGEPLVIHYDGEQQRAFLHVEDAVAGLIGIATSPALRGLPVNLGGDRPVRISDLARMVQNVVGGTVAMVNRPSSAVFGKDFAITRDRIPDTRRLRTATGWRPVRSIEDTVDDCVGHLRTLRAEAA